MLIFYCIIFMAKYQENQLLHFIFFQVRLPRNQLFVCRVSPKTSIQEILELVCGEKGFDPGKYEVRKAGKISKSLKFNTFFPRKKNQEAIENYFETMASFVQKTSFVRE